MASELRTDVSSLMSNEVEPCPDGGQEGLGVAWADDTTLRQCLRVRMDQEALARPLDLAASVEATAAVDSAAEEEEVSVAVSGTGAASVVVTAANEEGSAADAAVLATSRMALAAAEHQKARQQARVGPVKVGMAIDDTTTDATDPAAATENLSAAAVVVAAATETASAMAEVGMVAETTIANGLTMAMGMTRGASEDTSTLAPSGRCAQGFTVSFASHTLQHHHHLHG
jgi:hypothetical protein